MTVGIQRASGSLMPTAPGSNGNWYTWMQSVTASGDVTVGQFSSYASMGACPCLLAVPDSDGNASLIQTIDTLEFILALQGGICCKTGLTGTGTRTTVNAEAVIPNSGVGSNDWWAWSLDLASICQLTNGVQGGGLEAPPASLAAQLWVANGFASIAVLKQSDSFFLFCKYQSAVVWYASGALDTPAS
jgi:hypothetical protein